MSAKRRVLRIEFDSEDEFRREYVDNISKGGIFAASQSAYALREPVRVELVLAFCGECLTIDGEVVHYVPAALSESGATPGVAVHFLVRLAELRERFSPFIESVDSTSDGCIVDTGRRRAPRAPARVPVRIRTADGRLIEARCRDLSGVGVLVSLYGKPVPVGERISLQIADPATGRELEIDGRVARQVETDAGEISALGLAFETSPALQKQLTDFAAEICAAEHSRGLGSITGPISDIGIENLLQMFGTCAPLGTLTVLRGEEEGFVAFEKGVLCAARVGQASGLDALTRMLAWREGRFEFQTRVDWSCRSDEAPSLEAAVFEAMRRIDEQRRDEPA